MNMDEKDLKIISLLRENAKLRMDEISRKTGIPVTTVHSRIKKMEERGVIEGYTVRLNHEKLGLAVEAYVLVTVDYSSLKSRKVSQYDLARELKKKESVESVAILAGEKDMIVRVRVKSVAKLNEVITRDIRNVEGVEKTTTMIVLERV